LQIKLKDTGDNIMPMGRGTYGSRVGRPPKNKSNSRSPNSNTGSLTVDPRIRKPGRRNPGTSGQLLKNLTRGGLKNMLPSKSPNSKGGVKTAPVNAPKQRGTMGGRTATGKQPIGRGSGIMGGRTAAAKQPRNLKPSKPKSGVRTGTGSRTPTPYGTRLRGNKLKRF